MSVIRRSRLVNGVRVFAKKYTVTILVNGKPRRFPGHRSLAKSRKLERRLLDMRDDGELSEYEQFAKHKTTPIKDHLKDYLDWLETQGRDTEYRKIVKYRLDKIVDEAGITRLGGINLESFERWRSLALREKTKWGKRSGKTINQFGDSLRSFLNWCVDRGRLPKNPLSRLKRIQHIEPEYRRHVSREDFDRFLSLTTPERRNAYKFAMFTGLRRGTLEQLTWGDVRLNTPSPFLKIRGATLKGRRNEDRKLASQVVELLNEVKPKGAKDTDPIFPHFPSMYWLRKDLDAAGIDFKHGKGRGERRFDLHAFRKTAVEWLKEMGVSLEVASKVLGHTDIRTTQKHYSDPSLDRAAKAIEGLMGDTKQRKEQA